ncbi:MAG: hypothetical protein WCF95_07310, partial [bacterium]
WEFSSSEGNYVHFGPNEEHVIPIRFGGTSEIPDEISFVPVSDAGSVVFVIKGIREMFQREWNLRANESQRKEALAFNPGADRWAPKNQSEFAKPHSSVSIPLQAKINGMVFNYPAEWNTSASKIKVGDFPSALSNQGVEVKARTGITPGDISIVLKNIARKPIAIREAVASVYDTDGNFIYKVVKKASTSPESSSALIKLNPEARTSMGLGIGDGDVLVQLIRKGFGRPDQCALQVVFSDGQQALFVIRKLGDLTDILLRKGVDHSSPASRGSRIELPSEKGPVMKDQRSPGKRETPKKKGLRVENRSGDQEALALLDSGAVEQTLSEKFFTPRDQFDRSELRAGEQPSQALKKPENPHGGATVNWRNLMEQYAQERSVAVHDRKSRVCLGQGELAEKGADSSFHTSLGLVALAKRIQAELAQHGITAQIEDVRLGQDLRAQKHPTSSAPVYLHRFFLTVSNADLSKVKEFIGHLLDGLYIAPGGLYHTELYPAFWDYGVQTVWLTPVGASKETTRSETRSVESSKIAGFLIHSVEFLPLMGVMGGGILVSSPSLAEKILGGSILGLAILDILFVVFASHKFSRRSLTPQSASQEPFVYKESVPVSKQSVPEIVKLLEMVVENPRNTNAIEQLEAGAKAFRNDYLSLLRRMIIDPQTEVRFLENPDQLMNVMRRLEEVLYNTATSRWLEAMGFSDKYRNGNYRTELKREWRKKLTMAYASTASEGESFMLGIMSLQDLGEGTVQTNGRFASVEFTQSANQESGTAFEFGHEGQEDHSRVYSYPGHSFLGADLSGGSQKQAVWVLTRAGFNALVKDVHGKKMSKSWG